MPPFQWTMEDVVLEVEASDIDCLYYSIESPDDTGTFKKVVYVTICDASIIRRDERSTESSLILKNLKKLAGWTDPDWHTMDVSTEV